jgi:hypothetical protein
MNLDWWLKPHPAALNFYRALRRAYNAFWSEWNRARYQQRKRREQLQQEGF